MKRKHFVRAGCGHGPPEIVSLTDQRKTPAGNFNNVLKIAETNPLEHHSLEYKYYAADIGLLQDEQLKLVKYGRK